MKQTDKDFYFKMVNDCIDADKLRAKNSKIQSGIEFAEIDNILTAREAREMGYHVACTVCGNPTCNGDYTHYQTN